MGIDKANHSCTTLDLVSVQVQFDKELGALNKGVHHSVSPPEQMHLCPSLKEKQMCFTIVVPELKIPGGHVDLSSPRRG